MAIKQVFKHIKRTNKVVPVKAAPIVNVVAEKKEAPAEKAEVEKKPAPRKNNKAKKEEDMTLEGIERAEALAQNLDAPKEVKVVKKDRGLIERTESSKIVLTEDNRQVLND